MTRDLVVAAAERVVERVGVEATSVRAVALELGVTPGALYHHVASRQELIDAVADAFLAREVLRRLPRKGEPLDLLVVICRRLHAAGRAHPALLSAIVGHIPERTSTSQMEIAERMIAALRAAGADETRAHVLYRTLVSLCLGSALHEANLAASGPEDTARRLRLHAGSSTYPEVARYAERLAEPEATRWFDVELDVVLAGLRPGGVTP